VNVKLHALTVLPPSV